MIKIFKAPKVVRFQGILGGLAMLFIVISSIGAFVPLNPFMPAAHLDASWMYSLNEAVASGLVFGHDIVFTFGPFGSVYTKQFHPGTDGLMLVGGFLLALSLALGTISLARRGRWCNAVLISLALSQLVLSDSLFLSLPLLFLFLVADFVDDERDALTIISVLVLLISLSLLPLIKGTFAGLSAFILLLAFLMVIRQNRGYAFLGLLIFAVALVGFWGLADQPISAIPDFFISQSAIISGYTEAMAYAGNNLEVWTYAGGSFSLLLIFYIWYARGKGLKGLLVLVGVAVTLFFSFKTGFVRHDAHAVGAAGLLLLVALQLALALPLGTGVLSCCIGFLCGVMIAGNYLDLSFSENFRRFSQFYQGIEIGLSKRVIDGELNREFSESLSRIRVENPLPDIKGTADIYPIDQAILLAHGFAWAPRPIIQSYSAYNYILARRNELHLTADSAPKMIFFKISPLDSRAAPFDDGLSWPILLSEYSFVSLRGDFALLARSISNERRKESTRRLLLDETFALGSEFSLPRIVDPLWVEIDIEPTLLGKLLFLLFKPTELKIQIGMEDGRKLSYHYISAVGKAGFLLSPLVENTLDFVALASKARAEYFAGRRPVSIRLEDASGGSLIWKNRVGMKIFTINLPTQEYVDSLLFEKIQPNPPAYLPQGRWEATGECSIDVVNNQRAGTGVVQAQGLLKASGWGIVSRRDGLAPESMIIMLSAADGTAFYIPARKQVRNDVKKAFGFPEMGDTGFSIMADISKLKGDYNLSVLQISRGTVFSCPTKQLINILPSQE